VTIDSAIEPTNAPAGRQGSVVRLGLAVFGLLACGAAQYWIRHGDAYWFPATLLLVVAAVIVALQLPKPASLTGTHADGETASGPSSASRIIALVGFCIALGASYALFKWWHETFDWAAPTLLLGICVWSAGLAMGDRGRAGWAPPRPMPRAELVLFAGVMALDIFFRFYRYWEFPPATGFCSVEEAFTGRTADFILTGGGRPWEFLGDVWLPVPFFYLFGESQTTLRLGFTVVSALTVPALYFLLRYLLIFSDVLFKKGMLYVV
jgi:hypothetical protein